MVMKTGSRVAAG